MEDYTGQKYHKLIFLRYFWNEERNRTMWELQCDCGNLTIAAAYHVVSGAIRSCGCFKKGLRKPGQGSRKYEPMMSSAREVYNRSYKDQGLDFDIFFQLSQKNCFYCSRPPHQTFNISKKRDVIFTEQANFTYTGLDRVNPLRGHSADNIVPCCWTCNYMKRTSTVEEFHAQIKRIYETIMMKENNEFIDKCINTSISATIPK